MYENARYYRSSDDVIYRTMGVGYHINTGEHIIVMRNVSDGTVWCVPATDVNDRRLVNGKIVYKYTRCDEKGNDFINDYAESTADNSRGNGTNKSAYPGYTNDARLDTMSTTDRRNVGYSSGYNQGRNRRV